MATVGSIARAAGSLHVTPQTISGQLRTLEERLGSPLFQRVGRKLSLTETGQIVHSYVDPMFSLGLELGDVLRERSPMRPSPLSIGIATNVSKSIAGRVLRSILDGSARAQLHEASDDLLVSALLAGDIDLAVAGDGGTAAMPRPGLRSHLVGRCGLTFFCAAALADSYQTTFPRSLDGAPVVMPGRASALHRSLMDWFRLKRVAPTIVAEVESPDLASAVCENYTALFVLPTMLAQEAERRYRVSAVGDAVGVEQQFYVVCGERSARHVSIHELIDVAREHFVTPAPAFAAVLTRPSDSRRRRRARADALSAEVAEAARARMAAAESG